MKILLLKSNINDEATLQTGLAQVKQLCSTIGLAIDFDQKVTTTQFTSVPFAGSSPEVKSGWQINPQQILDEEKKYGNYEIDCLVFDPSKVSPTPPTNPTDNGEVIQIPTNWYANFPEVFAQFFLHELCHEMFWKYSKPDVTHNFYTSPFASKPNGIIDYYLFLLKGLLVNTPPVPPTPIPPAVSPYKHFSAKEVAQFKLKPALWLLLDKMRDNTPEPFVISSGLRTPQENAQAGGVANSAHLRGLAVDLLCSDNFKRSKMLSGIIPFRGEIFLELAKSHIHIDIDSSIHSLGQAMVSDDD